MLTHRWIEGKEDYSDALWIRRIVFMKEQGYSEQMEIVPEEDTISQHLVIYDDGKPVACGRLLPDKKPGSLHAGRIAVLKEKRGTGLGRTVVELLTKKAKEQGAEEVTIGAQEYAVPFYRKCGYIPCSVEYMDGHIPHVMMARTFALEDCSFLSFRDFPGAVLFRRDFALPTAAKKATLLLLPLGFCEGYLNGRRISEDLYAPAWSNYVPQDLSHMNYPIHDKMCHRAYYLEYDVTSFVQEGKNALALHIGDGWYGQWETRNEGVKRYGEKKLCYRLSIEGEDGQHYEFSSSDGGKYRGSFIKKTSMYFGERQDLRDYARADLTNEPVGAVWLDAAPASAPDSLLVKQTCPSDRVLQTIRNPKIIYTFGDTTIYDIGENLAGFAVLKFPNRSGANRRILVRYAENLNEDGSLNFHSTGGRNRISMDEFCSGDDNDLLLYPRFLWHAGRYIEVRGEHEFVAFCLAASDVRQTAEFSCADPVLNWLFGAYVRTQQSNIHCCVPSDCPHRERLGYTGDGQLTSRAALTVFDAKEMYRKWIRDIADSQDIKGGHVQHTAPFYGGGGGPGGWGCAMVAMPWNFYEFTGDLSILEDYYCHMTKYLDYMHTRCENHLVVREEPEGWCLGDWCPPYGKPQIPEPFVNTYFYIRSLRQVQKAAQLLGKEEDIPVFLREEEACLRAIKEHYLDPNTGSFCGGVEGADAFAMDLGLGDERTEKNLVQKYQALSMYDTGIFGTDLVTKVLFDRGHGETALALLTSRKEVSFGHMMDSGATTLWEYWFNDHSSSHPMFGAVAEYLFRDILGIRQREGSAGFREWEIKPAFLPSLDWARGKMQIPDGVLEVEVEHGKLKKCTLNGKEIS